jgi:hypothetical protein
MRIAKPRPQRPIFRPRNLHHTAALIGPARRSPMDIAVKINAMMLCASVVFVAAVVMGIF